MAFFIDLPEKQNIGSQLGAALGQGFQSGSQFGLQGQYNEMLQKQRETRAIAYEKEKSAEQQKLAAQSSSALLNAIQQHKGDPEAMTSAILGLPNVDTAQKKLAIESIQAIDQQKKSQEFYNSLTNSLNPSQAPAQTQQIPAGVNKPIAPASQGTALPGQQQPQGSFPQITDQQILQANTIDPSGKTGKALSDVKNRQEAARIAEQKDIRSANKERIQIHNLSKDYYDKLVSDAEASERTLDATKDMIGAMSSGKFTPASLYNFFGAFGEKGKILANAFKTAEQGKFEAALPNLLEGWKAIFGVRITDADLRLLQDKLPSLGKSTEANQAIINVIQKYASRNILKRQIADEVAAQNGGYNPIDFQAQVDQQYRQRISDETVKMLINGQTYLVPKNDVEGLIKQGAELVNK